MIPLFDGLVYPLLNRLNLLTTSLQVNSLLNCTCTVSPLQRIGAGFACAALAFAVSGIVDLQARMIYSSEQK